ncbi:MAG TPA: hypothetical protein VF719_10200 [Abditibacteriaceae bacterium]
MQLALIINSVVCVLGALGGLLFAGASIISIANMKVPWTGALVVAALLVPLAFVLSGIGAWVANARGASQLVAVLIAMPWLYGVAFVLVMLVSFR